MPLRMDATTADPADELREDARDNDDLAQLPDDPTINIDVDLERVDEDDIAGQEGYASPGSVDNLYLRDFGADDDDDDLPSTERQSNTWKIDHSSGHYRYKCMYISVLPLSSPDTR